MAQYWYKKDKRIKRISEQHDDRDVISQVKVLKSKGYVRIKDRRNPDELYYTKSKSKPKPKKEVKIKTKFNMKKK